MRNLKKILALVLALVMSLSVMSVASADFKDAADINANYEDAVEVLSGLGVFNGYKDAEGNYTFNPKGEISRKEVAAIIYRIDTGDMTADGNKIYADAKMFADVPADKWYAGYVNYCAQAGYIKGRTDGSFDPDATVTGYEALAMILRVVGYDKENEFAGAEWRYNVGKRAQELGITNMISNNTLGAAASRELVAELLFRTVKDAVQVNYAPFTGYFDTEYQFGTGTKNKTIGEEKWGLAKNKTYTEGPWGDPYYVWTIKNGLVEIEETIDNVEPLKVVTEQMDHCCIYDLVKDYLLPGQKTIGKWVNGLEMPALNIVDLKSTLEGGQGTTLKIYKDRIVIVETYLAKVTKAVDATYDAAGHLQNPARNDITVYSNDALNIVDNDGIEYKTSLAGNNFAKNTYLLVNVHYTGAVVPVSEATFVEGKQTFIWRNTNQHTIGSETKKDNENYALDKAENDKKGTYYWYLDAQGNVIGSDIVPPVEAKKEYVVVLGAYWNMPTLGQKAFCHAYVQKLDGSDPEWVELTHLDGKPFSYESTKGTKTFSDGVVYSSWQYNEKTNEHLYQIEGTKLTAVKPHVAQTAFKDGYPIFMDGEKEIFIDSKTTFVTRAADGLSLQIVTGYTNLDQISANKLGFNAYNVDYIMNAENKLFADVVYIESYKDIKGQDQTPEAPKPVYNYVYFTNDATKLDLGKDTITLLNCVDLNGACELVFTKDQFGSVEATWDALSAMATAYENTVCVVETTGGIVTKITPVAKDTKATIGKTALTGYFSKDYNFIGTDVLVLNEGGKKIALNTTENSVIYRQDGLGAYITDAEAQDLINLYLNDDNEEKANIYVVYGADRIVKAIFITDKQAPVSGTVVNAAMFAVMFDSFYANEMALNMSFTYKVAKDATVAEINADVTAIKAELEKSFAASNIATAVTMLGYEYTVVIEGVEFAEDEDKALVATVAFTFSCDGKTKVFTEKVTLTRAAE